MISNKSLPMPITVKPYQHQQQAFDFACMRFGLLSSDFRSSGVALLMEMGTGKTITSIGISGILYQFGRVNRILVVAPLSILGVWEEEFEKFAAFPYTLTVLKGTSAKKRQQLSEVGKTDGLEIVVVNYESARILEQELLKFNADLIIADEGHKLKENRSQQSKTMHTLGDHARYKLLLTGTLITNREIDAYSQYRYLNSRIFGTSFYAFRNRFFYMSGYGQHTPVFKKEMTGEFLRRLHSIAFRVTKAECLDLPEITEEIRAIDLEPKALKLYSRLLELQQELLKLANAKQNYDVLADEIDELREEKEELLLQEANKDGIRQRMADMVDYLKTEPEEVTEYSEALVRRMLEKITVYDDHFVVEFKSGIEITINE